MNFAIPFMRNFKYLNEDIQLNINYKPEIKELDNFIGEYKNHRVNLIIKDFNSAIDLDIIKTLVEKYQDSEIIVCLPIYTVDLEEIFNENNIKHYYNELVTSWDKFQGFLSLNVTDIFVAEEILFSAETLSFNAKQHNKKLRAFCNVCQSSWDKTPSIKTFFVRPEDLFLYNDIIDTFEFYVDEKDYVKMNTLYEIYTKNKKWYGKLSEIIVGYEGKEDSRFIIPNFGNKRLNCGKKCMYGIKPSCHICDRVQELEQLLKKEKIAVKIENK